jgi:cytochrome c oxidase subunit 4
MNPNVLEHHVLPVSLYTKVFVALLIGLVLTVLAAGFDFGPFNFLVAMIISVSKASLVVLYFMNVRYGTRLIWLWAGLGFLWMLLLFLTLGDYITRGKVVGW